MVFLCVLGFGSFIVLRALIEYCGGPLFVGGSIATVQCTLWRAVCSYVRAAWLGWFFLVHFCFHFKH